MDKIMIIEDDPAICLGLEDLLSDENFEVISFPDGKDGLQNALSILPDLIILDINLPGMNGLDVCRALRESSFNNPIVMLTARSEQLDKIIGLEICADDYLTKPFDRRELLARVRAQLRRSARTRESAEAKSLKHGHKRKLLTIMFTDVKDYSKKMSNDENMTIDLLKTHNSMMNKMINDYNGDIVETAGDA